MKIIEFNMPDTAQEVQKLLLSRGWEQIGEGYYAEVYSKPHLNYVLKVVERDSAYLAFLKMIAQHPNPHFPRVIGKVRITPKYYGVRLEKLQPLQSVDVEGYQVRISGMISAYLIDKRTNGKMPDYQQRNLEFAELYLMDKPKLVQALDLIHEELLGKFTQDIGDDIMMRKDGTVVIIDPVDR